MSDNARRTAFRTAAQGAPQRGAATPVTTRAQALSGTFRPLQRADNLPDKPSAKDPDDKDPKDVIDKAKDDDKESLFDKKAKDDDKESLFDKKAKDDDKESLFDKKAKDDDKESLFDKKAKDDEDAEKKAKDDEIAITKGAAGSGGDFKPMGGSEDAFDANADATTPANNDTGAPETPSGF